MRNSYAVITGASSGIGEEFARRLCGSFRLILVARRRERLERLAEELNGQGGHCAVIAADLSEEEACFRLMEELRGKRISVFINNAGSGVCGSFLDTDLEGELGMIGVNVRAVHILTKLVLQKMRRQGGGRLLNVASSAGLLPAGPYMAAYYASKAYVVSLTRAAARELKGQGLPVYVGALCPGPVDTEFGDVAGVAFALRSITAQRCVDCALRGMRRGKTVIVPTVLIKLAATMGHLAPPSVSVRITEMQQKKKLGGQKTGQM